MTEQGSWWRHCCSRGGAAAEMTARRLCARRDVGVGAVEMAMVVARGAVGRENGEDGGVLAVAREAAAAAVEGGRRGEN